MSKSICEKCGRDAEYCQWDNLYGDGGTGCRIRELERQLAAAQARIAELESQLPEGMTNCTIVFKECSKGP